mgnify:CR=1 FL=1
MFRRVLKGGVIMAAILLFLGCGHVNTSKVGLISFGNLEGKIIPANPTGPILEGSASGPTYFLSDAARDALKSGEYDTLVDVEVISETGFLVTSNKVTVRGTAIDSKSLEKKLGGAKE